MEKYHAQKLISSEWRPEYVREIESAIESLEASIYGNEVLSDRFTLTCISMVKAYKKTISLPYNILNDNSEILNKELERIMDEET